MKKTLMQILSIFFFSMVVCLVSASVFGQGNSENQQKSQDEYVIGAGDNLSIQVWREPNLSGNFTVRPDGKITFPLLNDIKAEGLTPLQLKKVIETGLTDRKSVV